MKTTKKKKLTKEELVARLNELRSLSEHDPEAAHSVADDLLIEFINNEEIKKAYDSIHKWYA